MATSEVRTIATAPHRFSWEIYGYFVPTYTKVNSFDPILLLPLRDPITRIPYIVTDPSRRRHVVYVSSNLLHVVAVGDVCDLPSLIRVTFKADEWPSTPKEANRLVPETYETLRDTVFGFLDSPNAKDADKLVAEQRLAAIRETGIKHGAVLEWQ